MIDLTSTLASSTTVNGHRRRKLRIRIKYHVRPHEESNRVFSFCLSPPLVFKFLAMARDYETEASNVFRDELRTNGIVFWTTASVSNLKSNFHGRSISLPSKHHPLIRQANEQLDRLRCSDAAASPSLSLASSRISCPGEFYNSLDDSLLLLYAKQSFAREECCDKLLDRSLRLLDLCSSTKDVIVQTKESVQELQSALCRRHGDKFGLRNEVARYLTSRKMVKNMIKGCLKNLKSSHDFAPSDPDNMVSVSMLREAEEIALGTFESLLHSLYGTKAQDKRRGWSLVSKLVHSKRAEAEVRETSDEFLTADAAVNSLLGSKLGMSGDLVEDLKQMLRGTESSIQDLDKHLESLQRHLIKTRASLLNMLTH